MRPLLRTDFSGLDSGKLLGIVTKGSWLSLGSSRLLGGPTRLVNVCAFMWYRILKKLRVELLNFVMNRLYQDSWTTLVELGPTFHNMFIKVVALLAHSLDSDSNDMETETKPLGNNLLNNLPYRPCG